MHLHIIVWFCCLTLSKQASEEPAWLVLACFTPATATVRLQPVTQEVLLARRHYDALPRVRVVLNTQVKETRNLQAILKDKKTAKKKKPQGRER